jgi:WD40 repeat protein
MISLLQMSIHGKTGMVASDLSGDYALTPLARFPLKSPYRRLCCLLSVTSDGRTVAAGSVRTGAHFFDVTAGKEIRTLNPGYAECFVAITADGRLAATWNQMNETRRMQIWDVASSNVLHEISLPNGSNFAAFSPNGRWLAAGDDFQFRVFDVKTWQQLYAWPREAGGYWAYLAYSHDSRLLAVALSRNVIQLVEAATGRELARLEPPESHAIQWIAFDDQDARLAVAAGIVQLWDLRVIRRRLASMGLDWETAR